MFDDLPFLGAGLMYETHVGDAYFDYAEEIGFLEIPTDVFLRRLPACSDQVLALKAAFKTVAHGTHLALGDAGRYRTEYLERLQPFLDLLEPVWFSDHLDTANLPDPEAAAVAHGVPVPFTDEQADVFRKNMARVAQRIGRPLLIENLAYDVIIPVASRLSEPAFIERVLDGTNHGLLLDLANLHTNAVNFGFDPYEWLAEAPLDRVVELHVAGNERRCEGPLAGRLYDSHSQPVPDEVWELAEYVVGRAAVRAITVERGNNLPPLPDLIGELRIATQILTAARTHV